MRTLFASDFAGDVGVSTPASSVSLNKHNIAARSGNPATNNAVSFTGTLGIATGLRGTGHCWVAPDAIALNYNNVSVQYPEPITATDLAFDFLFAASVISQHIVTLSGSGDILSLDTDASGALTVEVNGITYTSALILDEGSVYDCEIVAKIGAASNGAFQVRIDGLIVAVLSVTGITTGGGSVFVAVEWTNTSADNLRIGAVVWRGGADAFSTSLFLGGGTEGKVHRVADHFVVADGNYTGYARVTGPLGGSADNPSGSDWEQIDDPAFDGFDHYLFIHAIMTKQSWVYEPFDDYAIDTTPTIITVFQHIVSAGNINATVPVQFLRIDGADLIDPTLQNLETAAPAGNLDQWGLTADSNSQWGGCAMAYDTNPDTGLAWQAAELAALEGGYFVQRYVDPEDFADDASVTQALLTVVWIDGEVPTVGTPTSLEAVCEPCTGAADAFYVDAGVPYDGRNTASLNAAKTPSWATTTLTLANLPSGIWDAGSSHTLDADAAIFVGVAGDWVGLAIKLIAGEESVVCDITAYGSTTSLTVTVRTAVPESLQALASSEWGLMILVLSLPHLEGELVSILSDGVVQPQDTVTGGEVVLADHGMQIVAGLPFLQRARINPIAPYGGPELTDRYKNVGQVSLLVERTRDVLLGAYDPILQTVEYDRHSADPHKGTASEDPAGTWTRDMVKIVVRGHGSDDVGQIEVAQDQPIPLGLRGMILHISIGKD